ncbi:unnamed protein product [Phyllotreta striolata]|uniref:Uncharacterized protein n=1 Tax=Phyllotreta striolata TaxID=444603 RepID=A0A9N9TVH0_PHYSR|nr:unnamed protein product [Phyllotreta striolata]
MDTLKFSLLFVLLLSPQVFANSNILGELTTTDSAFGITSSSITSVLVEWIARIVDTSEASLSFLSFLFPQQSHAETEEVVHEEHAIRPSEMPPLVRDERPMVRETKQENYPKPAEESPFADQVRSLDMLIRAQKRNMGN